MDKKAKDSIKDNRITKDNTKENNKNYSMEVDVMAVSIKPSPIFRGASAKKLVEALSNPPNNSELFKRCEELSKAIKTK